MPSCPTAAALFVAQDFGGNDAGGVAGGRNSGQETHQDGGRRDPYAIHPARFEGDEAQRVDGFVQADPAVLVGEIAERVTHREADGAADDSDEYALQHEDAADLRAARAHGHQDGDVTVLFHHHHHQHDQNIERGHQLDQTYRSEEHT